MSTCSSVTTPHCASRPTQTTSVPAVLTKFEGTELFNFSPLIRAYMSVNVALTGAGASSIIDGAGENWFNKASSDTDKLRAMGNDSTPVYERVFGKGHKLPPNFVEPFGSVNVLLQGFTLTGSPFWTVHPVDCENVIVRNLTVRTAATKNSDGCDPEGSRDVLIEGNYFDTGDDAVAIKAGRDADGWRVGRPTENIVVRRNTMAAKTNALCIGSEMSGGVSNVYAYDNVVSQASAAIYFKSNLDRGSWIRDVDVWGTRAASVSTCIEFANGYHGGRGGDFPSLFRGFNIHDNVCTKASGAAISAGGLAELPLQDVNISGLLVPEAAKDFKISNCRDWRLRNVSVNGNVTNMDINVTSEELPARWPGLGRAGVPVATASAQPLRGLDAVAYGVGRPLATRHVRNTTELKAAMEDISIDTIVAAGGVYRLAEVAGLGDDNVFLNIERNLTIRADAGAAVNFDGGDQKGLVYVNAGVYASLQGLEATNGNANQLGGGAFHNDGALTVINCSVHHNSAYGGGGGIANGGGALTIINSSVHQNHAPWGGGLHNHGTLTITGSSVHHNTAIEGAPSFGGGILNTFTLHATSTTVCSNTPDDCDDEDVHGHATPCATPLPPCPPPASALAA